LPALALGWQGAAWLEFQHERAGILPPAGFAEAVRTALRNELRTQVPEYRTSLFIGAAADVLVAGYAVASNVLPRAELGGALARLDATASRSRHWDVFSGAAGALLALSELDEVLPGCAPRSLGRSLSARLRHGVEALSRAPAAERLTGLAHGVAGALLASETAAAHGWSRLPAQVRQRLFDLLTSTAIEARPGALVWPRGGEAGPANHLGLQSWCAGTPGVALALLVAADLSGESAYRELAEGALAGAELLAAHPCVSASLCCGSAGYGHIFLEAYVRTGQRRWLDAARACIVTSEPNGARGSRSLFKGQRGAVYLAERVSRPHALHMPGLGTIS